MLRKKNTPSFFQSEISLVEGNISSLQNLFLTIKNEIYKIDLIDFKNQKLSEISLKNVKTPNKY